MTKYLLMISALALFLDASARASGQRDHNSVFEARARTFDRPTLAIGSKLDVGTPAVSPASPIDLGAIPATGDGRGRQVKRRALIMVDRTCSRA
jgi:hypothetical protein